MKSKLSRLSVALAVIGGCWICQGVVAAPVTVVQDYSIAGNPNNRDDLRNTLITATIRFDDGPVPDTGQIFMPVDSVGLEFSDRALPGLPPGLNFLSMVDPTVVHLFAASYNDGVYRTFGWVDDGGGLFRAQFFPSGPGINLISFTHCCNGGEGQLSFTINNAPRYNIDALGPPVVTVAAVPVPAVLPMFLGGLAGLGVMARRRHKPAPV